MTTYRPTESSVSESEKEILTWLAIFAVTLGVPVLLWTKATVWLVHNHVLVSAQARPLWHLPGAAGAGLDLPRLAVLIGLGVGLAAIVLTRARRNREADQEL